MPHANSWHSHCLFSMAIWSVHLSLGCVGHHVERLQALAGHAILEHSPCLFIDTQRAISAGLPLNQFGCPTKWSTPRPLGWVPGSPTSLGHLLSSPMQWKSPHLPLAITALGCGLCRCVGPPTAPHPGPGGVAFAQEMPQGGWTARHPPQGAMGHSIWRDILTGLEANKPKWPSVHL